MHQTLISKKTPERDIHNEALSCPKAPVLLSVLTFRAGKKNNKNVPESSLAKPKPGAQARTNCKIFKSGSAEVSREGKGK